MSITQQATPHSRGTHLWFKLMAKCHLTPKRSLLVERNIRDRGGSPCALWFGGGFAAPTPCRGGRASWEPCSRSQRILSLPFHPTARPGAGWQPPFCFTCCVSVPRWSSEHCHRPTLQRTRTVQRPRSSWKSPTCGCGCWRGRAVPASRVAPQPHHPCTSPSTTSSSRAAASAMATLITASPSLGSSPSRQLEFSMWYVRAPSNACPAGKWGFKHSKGRYRVWCSSKNEISDVWCPGFEAQWAEMVFTKEVISMWGWSAELPFCLGVGLSSFKGAPQ